MTNKTISTITDAKIGLAQGIILGDPDTSAIDRISRSYPQVHVVSALLHNAGLLLGKNGYAAVNSQNTAFLRQFAPTMFCPPGIGRGDDIVAGLLTQRAMRDAGYQVHFGRPFCFQERNVHDLVKDLREEMWLTENINKIVNWLQVVSGTIYDEGSLGLARQFYGFCDVLPLQTREAGLAWCEDIVAVTR